MNNRVIVGISGASGAPLAVDVVRSLHAAGMEMHLVVTRSGGMTLRHECGLSAEDLAPCCAAVYDNADIGTAIASGSFRTRGMIVVPASMKTVAGIACGYSDNLLLRAARSRRTIPCRTISAAIIPMKRPRRSRMRRRKCTMRGRAPALPERRRRA